MAKKGKAARLPKKVGGVKLPKQLRKSAGVVAELAQNPIAREVVSAALVAGAGALAKRRFKGTATPPAAKAGGELDHLIAQGKEVGNMLAQGVAAFLGELFKAPEHPAGQAETASTPIPAEPKPVPPKRAAPKSSAVKAATTERKPPRARSNRAATPKSPAS
ncbi:hypothetical protein ACSBM8_13695 [Sphingomonas sp. ASY06-1R]|jgi:hypothetical protein|uniref:hypothetical protein n=1 Tax=Sphingomonas sp. ASY06-1R TaxID=3445771 RepID=UPI003FA210DF